MSSPQLTPPVGARDHAHGPGDAPVTLVEYGDYECPHCARAHPVVRSIQERLGDRLRFVFRNFPLAEAHPHAEHAAEAAEWADRWGKFWEMHDMLFERRRDDSEALTDANLARYASALGLDASDLELAIAEETYRPRVREDFLSGVRSGVNGTPTFFINGSRHDGLWDEDSLLAALAAEVARRGTTAGAARAAR